MRFTAPLIGAVLITTLIFLFIQSLILSRQQDEVQIVAPQSFEIVRPPPPQETPPEPTPQQRQQPEPSMAELESSLPASEPDVELEAPIPDIAMGDLAVAAAGRQWSSPLGAGGTEVLEAQAIGAQGFVEVVPFSTRKPNVPELAWNNQVSGWVLVAFNVTPEGTTRKIRVLDANPRGVFEETVIAAVQDWLYSVSFSGEVPGDVVVTQKVEVDWEDYPMNVSHLD